ncbi:hypothetical protein THIAE_10475 [Thiomicrospira aerophila AL3]|uniref:Uncharacterized protein n=1 Tax=Thiomicrospira aerophila AL3 TaxID=717772 RepID=W0DXX1_9GAMM|nr:hypothetical protein [Thiomicrospira aerophila]AHF02128.1 hypothetical protein THIAE_10475 [Thiomicrospira aerophila AL3]
MLISISTVSLALDARDTRLLLVGGEFFPRIVQALVPNNSKPYRLVIVYSNQANLQLAEQMASNLSNQLNLSYQLMPGLQPSQLHFDEQYDYLVFITDPDLIKPELLGVLNQRNILSFSPFVGSVAKGVDVGLIVRASIRPQINQNQILHRDWRFRPFFNSIADFYSAQGRS